MVFIHLNQHFCTRKNVLCDQKSQIFAYGVKNHNLNFVLQFFKLKYFTHSPLESIFYILFGEKTIEINNLISWPLPPTPS